jgi:gamma-butyrobetaine dioxygenase
MDQTAILPTLGVEATDRVDMRDLAPTPTGCRLTAVKNAGDAVTVEWDDGRRGHFHAVWLRDNCACRACRHPQTMERQFLLIEAPEDLTVADAQVMPGGHLLIRFAPEQAGGEAHLSHFDAGWLYQYCYADWARAGRVTSPNLWDASMAERIPAVDYTAMMETDGGLADWLTALRDWGIVLLREAPAKPDEMLRIAGRVGPARWTNFGLTSDVVSMPNPNNSAFTSAGLEPHTDLPNWHRPPDFQVLFCLASEAQGGASILVNGLRVAEELRANDPEAFRILSTRPIDFRFHDEEYDIRHRAPMIEVDQAGHPKSIHFNNWIRAVIDVPEADMEATYGALRTLWRLLRDRRFQIRLRLEAGEMVAFDNAYVLHGREAFDPITGRRHMQTCYLDRDLVFSRLRLLERRR